MPRKSPVRKNTVTPWSTYDHSTPIRLPRKNAIRRPSLSPSPVAHSKSPVPPSPVVINNQELEDDRDTPSITEYPHESMQLPRRTAVVRKARMVRPPIDVIEDFIKDLSIEAKEAVRASYNGPDWPGKRASLSGPADYGSRKSIAALSSYSSIMPPVYPTPVTNRFLVGLPSYHTPQVVYHYFPRGC